MPPKGRRPAGGPDTRALILDAAREQFAALGYDRTTMRSVAARAGVDPALIHHYFGTKDGLLAEALMLPVDPATLLAGLDADPSHAGVHVVRRVVGLWEADVSARRRWVGLYRTSISHEHAAEVLRDVLGRTILQAVADVAAPDRRPLRAALIGSRLGGLVLGRYVQGVPAERDASPEELVAAIGPVVQHYLTGEIAVPGAASRRRRGAAT